MFCFGVCKLDDYEVDRLPFGRFRAALRRKRISMKLLRMTDPPSPRAVMVFERLMWEMALGSGISRTTRRGRFASLDPQIDTLLRRRYSRDTALRVCDWAAADGLTSTEWASSLFAEFPNASLTASDLTHFLVEISDTGGATVIQDAEGHPIQVIRPPFVIRLQPPESWLVPVNLLIAKRVLSRFAAQAPKVPQEWLDSEDEFLSVPPFEVRKISVIHPETRAFAARDPRFSMTRHSVFDALANPVDVIRTMNIFNRSYFPTEQLANGVRAVAASLVQGGIWIVGRSQGSVEIQHTVSILEKTANGFRVLERVNGGSEIEDLALSA